MAFKILQYICCIFAHKSHIVQFNSNVKCTFCISTMGYKLKMENGVVTIASILRRKLNFNNIIMCKMSFKQELTF